jgi:hypothetical protein
MARRVVDRNRLRFTPWPTRFGLGSLISIILPSGFGDSPAEAPNLPAKPGLRITEKTSTAAPNRLKSPKNGLAFFIGTPLQQYKGRLWIK